MKTTVTGLAALLLSVAAAAQDELSGANTSWIMTSTALVLFMTLPGLALFYAGLVRSKNVLSVLMQCFSIACVASVVWFVAGYSLAFSEGNNFIGDLSNMFLANVTEDSMSGDIPESVFLMFQMTFAIITPALVIGGFAERIKFSAVMLFTVFWLLAVYAPVCHWVWGGGWLGDKGALDFAGGIVVHITAGVAALVAALMVGPRSGFPSLPMPPHNLTLSVAGAGMLWVGWFGFNGGSALGANGDAGMAILVTHLSAACGAATWSIIEWVKYGKPSVLGIITGMVAGLGTITPASGFVGPAGAMVIGISAGVVCFYATLYMKQKLKIDDSLDVMPVHGVGGILGTLAVAVFASSELGLFSGQGLENTISDQLWIQSTGIAVTIAYTAVVTYIIFKVIGLLTGGIRVDEDQEAEGLDLVSHNERGYDI
ncbi:MAG TPA: ammonia channel protein [Cellvibrionales bacterium]|nr:ammonia channel protein [Cellvibrionales bacterium]